MMLSYQLAGLQRAVLAGGVIALLCGGGLTPAGAQLTIPVLSTASTASPARTDARPASAAEAAYYVSVKAVELKEAIAARNAHYPIDSLLTVVSATGAEWLARLQAQPITGLQHDAAGRVGVAAGREDYAKAQIAERLATPGLRLSERAFTLATAIKAFADPYHPKRLSIAEAYLTQLEALGENAAYWQLDAHAALQATYYQLGRSAEVAQHGVRAIQQLRVLPYLEQPYGGRVQLDVVYLMTVEALSGQPNGRPQIDTLNRIIRATYAPPPALLARDSGLVGEGEYRRSRMEQIISIAARLGTPGAPLLSNYWVNRPATDSAVVPVNDGKIRLIEVFSYGCDGCLLALQSLQRLQQRFPTTIEAVATTFTMGYWANRLVSPEEEAQKLNEYFVNQLKITFPVAIWKWAKVPAEDGGYRFADNPNGVWGTPIGVHYPLIVKPTTYVVDGHGQIRRVFVAAGRDFEAEMLRTIEFLQREAATQVPPS